MGSVQCISSEYRYRLPRASRSTEFRRRSYDPEYEGWELGKISALFEIALALNEDYKYYYMGTPDVMRVPIGRCMLIPAC